MHRQLTALWVLTVGLRCDRRPYRMPMAGLAGIGSGPALEALGRPSEIPHESNLIFQLRIPDLLAKDIGGADKLRKTVRLFASDKKLVKV